MFDLGGTKHGHRVLCRPRNSYQQGFHGHVELLPKGQNRFHVQTQPPRLWQASERHQQFRGTDVTDCFKLPLVGRQLRVSRTISDLFRAVREECVSDLVSDRVPHAATRSVRVELDSDPRSSFGDRSSVAHVVGWQDAQSQVIRQAQRVERGTGPARIDRVEDDLPGPLGYRGDGVLGFR
jgi:hypothetical protein